MSDIELKYLSLPVIYSEFKIDQFKEHINFIKESISNGQSIEVFLCEAKIVVPITKYCFSKKEDILAVIIRSGDIDRSSLEILRRELNRDNEIKVKYTPKKKLISRVIVNVPINDIFAPLKILNILEKISIQIESIWPDILSVGYPSIKISNKLPGELIHRYPFDRAAFNAGKAVGRATGQLSK